MIYFSCLLHWGNMWRSFVGRPDHKLGLCWKSLLRF